MKTVLFRHHLLVKKSPIHGYGVFADQDIEPGALLEECYLLYRKANDPDYSDYYFSTGEYTALALGYGSIYNHADTPNADCNVDLVHSLLLIRANRLIHKGEEILINYGDDWFKSRLISAKYPLRYKLRKYKKTIWFLLRFSLVAGLLLSLTIFQAFFN